MRQRKNLCRSKQSEVELKVLEPAALVLSIPSLEEGSSIISPFLYEGADGADAA